MQFYIFLMHIDNNLKYYDNRTLAERFTETIKNKKYCIGKSIIKGNLKNIKLQVSKHQGSKEENVMVLANLFYLKEDIV